MTPEEKAELQQKLVEARAAYHKLMVGQSSRVVVDGADGSRVEFTVANRAALYQYIRDLETRLNPDSTAAARAYRPMGFFF